MSATAFAADPDIVSKGEFARRRNVSAGRVSQWISEGKISGAAIVGEGRFAHIRESVAVEQLRRKLDPMQMTANGLSTVLTAAPPSVPASPVAGVAEVLPFPPAADQTPVDTLEEKIKQQRLEQLERANRAEHRKELQDAGALVDAASVREATGRALGRLISEFDGAMASFATAISAEFKLPQRDVLHLLRGEFRKFRADQAKAVNNALGDTPAMVDFDDDAAVR